MSAENHCERFMADDVTRLGFSAAHTTGFLRESGQAVAQRLTSAPLATSGNGLFANPKHKMPNISALCASDSRRCRHQYLITSDLV